MATWWAFAFLVIYPAVQVPLLWVVVRHFDLRNDDGPRDPVGYAARVEDDVGGSSTTEDGDGRCPNCGLLNDPVAEYCRNCLAGLAPRPV